MIASARLAAQARRAAEWGVRIPHVEVDFAAVMDRARGLVAEARQELERDLQQQDGLRLFRAEARLDGREDGCVRVRAGDDVILAERVVLDTGTRSLRPRVDGLDQVPLIDLESWIGLRELPRRLVFLGGGTIALEMAQAFRRFGAEVAIVEQGSQLTEREDPDVAEALRQAMLREGIEVHLNSRAERAEAAGAGVRLHLHGGAAVEGSHLFLAAGRQPNTDALGLDSVGVRLSDKGIVQVDERLDTGADGIWAAGDIRGGPQFTHTAYDDFRILRSRFLGDGAETTRRVVPYAIFTEPELGRVGLSETEARAAGNPFRVGRFNMANSGKARELGRPEGFIKVLVGRDGRIIGAAALCEQGAEVVQLFVQLIAAEGTAREMLEAVHIHPTPPWPRPPRTPSGTPSRSDKHMDTDANARAAIQAAAEPLPDLDDPAFAAAFDRFASARVVLLGESTHGTAEFYRARAAITRRLIERNGFRIVALEADWPDMTAVDRWARRDGSAPGSDAFARFPRWMWRNEEFACFAAWLRQHNAGVAQTERTALRGLDLYSLGASIGAVLDYLDREDPASAAAARRRYGCLTPYQDRPARYGREAEEEGLARCEEAVVAVLRGLLDRRLAVHGREDLLDAVGTARVVADAEAYYRASYRGNREGWNLRDRHMARVLSDLLDRGGPDARAVVWAHNSHVGDARATEMGWGGQLTLGQLCRERWGPRAALIGLSTSTGTAVAADDWDGEGASRHVRPATPGSWEALCAGAALLCSLLDLRDPALAAALPGRRLERAIGVVYRPATERWSHYFEAELPGQFDAWTWFATTKAVTPLPAPPREKGGAETWPTGV